MKKVYICSPCRGDYENNIQRAKEFSRAAVERDCIPITPHIYLTQFMDDTVPAERELGLSIGRELVLMCDELWAFGLDCPTAGINSSPQGDGNITGMLYIGYAAHPSLTHIIFPDSVCIIMISFRALHSDMIRFIFIVCHPFFCFFNTVSTRLPSFLA